MKNKNNNYNLMQKATTVFNVEEVLISKLTVNPYQPRISMDEIQLRKLALSIAEEGLLQPILISPNENNDGYIILAGHRRVEAHRLLNRETIKALIREKVDRAQLAIIPIIENLQRDDINPIESAIIFKRLLDEKIFSSQVELAQKIFVSKSWVSRILSILRLPKELLKIIKEDKFRDISVLAALNKLNNKDSKAAYLAIKGMTRADAIRYISSIKEKEQLFVTKPMVVVYKNKVTIDMKNINQSKQREVESLIAKIKEILE